MSDKSRAVLRIGGAAGDGIASAGDILAKTASRMGLWVYAYNSYQSVIRGGHVYYQLQIGGGEKVLSHGDDPDVLIALNQDTVKRHAAKVKEGGVIIFNSDKIKVENITLNKNVQTLGIPVTKLTEEFGRNPIMQNTVDSGALINLLGLDWASYESAISTIFAKKPELLKINLKVAKKGFDYAKENGKSLGFTLKGDGKKRAFVTGNAMFAYGLLSGGCKFYAAYPMTPASQIMHWLAPRASKYGMVMKQMEDEIAAMNVIVGAAQTGARAATGTAGGGFSLMTEGVGLAAMLETPVVVVHVQRGGPSTGLPTKTEQGDLFQDIGASQGEYPKVIIAPTTVQDCYNSAVEAMNISDKYQIPVILLSDLYLSEHTETLEDGKITNDVPIDRGEIVKEWKKSDPAKTEKESWFVAKNSDDYLRYKDTPSGVSPRALPGTPNTLYVSASDEHDEEGIVISDVFTDEEVRFKMMNKRMRKMAGLEKDTKGPIVDGPKSADVTLVGWGSTYQVIEEVRLALEKKGKSVNHIHFRTMWPIHAKETKALLDGCKKTIDIECNYTSQLQKLVRMETGVSFDHLINKYDGEPFGFEELLKQVEDCLSGKTEPSKELAFAGK